MEEQAFRDFLKTNIPQKKTHENLLSVAEYIRNNDSVFSHKYSEMAWYYRNVFCLDPSSTIFQFAMYDFLKDYFTNFADRYGYWYIDMMNAHFSS